MCDPERNKPLIVKVNKLSCILSAGKCKVNLVLYKSKSACSVLTDCFLKVCESLGSVMEILDGFVECFHRIAAQTVKEKTEAFSCSFKNLFVFNGADCVGFINVPLPKKLDVEDGKLFDFLCDTIRIRNEKEEYTIGGDMLMYSGFKAKQLFNYSGFNFSDSRIILDNDSRIYYLEKTEG